jgi:2-polyprenyl-6-methoxyphenol hydroxylase-like FAD-dependent oxidoreductase
MFAPLKGNTLAEGKKFKSFSTNLVSFANNLLYRYSMETITTTCCIAGGGPAGMMLGFLLARAGIDVVVIEKHGDFLRDFRGDTVHPSTLELMHELGILKEFLKLPHSEVHEIGGEVFRQFVMFAEFKRINTKCKFVAFMPQWDFLDFLADMGKKYPSFQLRMNTEVTDVIEEGGKIVGVKARAQTDGEVEIRAKLVVAADGRGSVLREKAGLKVIDVGAPMDVLWMRLSRKPTDPPATLGRAMSGVIFVMLNRNEYWQCGYVIPKGKLEELKAEGIESFRKRVETIVPFVSDRVQELASWDDIKLLTVKVDRLEKWYRDGFLCIGDSAHAMSPVGGVGINLAIQDAVAAANLLWEPLSRGEVTEADLQKVQDRRLYPTRMTQRLQVFLQNNAIRPTLESNDLPPRLPLPLKMFRMFPPLRAVPANLIGIGFRPEHIHSPERKPAAVP